MIQTFKMIILLKMKIMKTKIQMITAL